MSPGPNVKFRWGLTSCDTDLASLVRTHWQVPAYAGSGVPERCACDCCQAAPPLLCCFESTVLLVLHWLGCCWRALEAWRFDFWQCNSGDLVEHG